MFSCNTSWEKWLYLLAVVALIIGLFGSNTSMILLAVLLAIAAYLIKKSSVASTPKEKTSVKPKNNKPKSKKKK